MTPTEVDRLAHMTAALRPDWPLTSLRTLLAKFTQAQPHRSYPDTAHALVELAMDEATRNPGRLAENGPWWAARPGEQPQRKITMGQDATFCPQCRGLIIPGDPDPHLCRVTSSADGRAEARRVAAEVRGRYEREMGERVEAQQREAS